MSEAGFSLLLSTVFFAFVNTGVKFLTNLPASEIVFFRGLITLIISFYFLKKNKLNILGNNKKILVLRGIFGTIALYSLFHSLKIMPLALATTFVAMNSIFAAVVFHIFLNEKSNINQYIFLFLALGGVLLIKGLPGSEQSLNWEQLFWGLLTPISSAFAYACVRKLGPSDHPLVVIFYFPFISTPVMAPYLVAEGILPEFWELGIILVVGVFTQFAQYYMTVAFQKESASGIAIYNYAGVIWGALIGYFLFREKLQINQVWGILVILICLLSFEWLKRKNKNLSI